jgi:hypothetical protein
MTMIPDPCRGAQPLCQTIGRRGNCREARRSIEGAPHMGEAAAAAGLRRQCRRKAVAAASPKGSPCDLLREGPPLCNVAGVDEEVKAPKMIMITIIRTCVRMIMVVRGDGLLPVIPIERAKVRHNHPSRRNFHPCAPVILLRPYRMKCPGERTWSSGHFHSSLDARPQPSGGHGRTAPPEP